MAFSLAKRSNLLKDDNIIIFSSRRNFDTIFLFPDGVIARCRDNDKKKVDKLWRFSVFSVSGTFIKTH